MSGSWPRRTPLASNLRLLRLGLAAELRNAGLRLIGVVGALAAAGVAWSHGPVAPSSALVLSLALARGFGVAACLWFAYAANRDQTEQEGALFRSKPVDGTRWVLIRWATGLTAWIALMGLGFLGAALGQLPHAGALSLAVHGWGFLRAIPILAGPATLSFALSRSLRSPLGGVITVFGWFCAMAGMRFIPLFMQIDYAQNLTLLLGLALFALAVSAALLERSRRGELRRPAASIAVVVLAAVIAGAGAARAYVAAPKGDDHHLGAWIARQHLVDGQRMPGFWLPDGRGGTVRTAAYTGKILVLFLFVADDMESARTLPAMDAIQKELGPQGVQCLGVCISPNHGDGPALVRSGAYHFPIAFDPETARANNPPETPVAGAFTADQLPLLVITDRQRKVRYTGIEPFYDADTLRPLVQQRLAAEPD